MSPRHILFSSKTLWKLFFTQIPYTFTNSLHVDIKETTSGGLCETFVRSNREGRLRHAAGSRPRQAERGEDGNAPSKLSGGGNLWMGNNGVNCVSSPSSPSSTNTWTSWTWRWRSWKRRWDVPGGFISCVSLHRVSDSMRSLSVCVVCWRRLLGVADGAAWRLFCPSVQLLPHPRELRTEGECVKLWNGPRCWYDCSVFCSLRFTTWPSPLSWCKTEAWRNQKPGQKVVTHLLQKYRMRKESLIYWWSRHIKGRPVEGNLCSPWQKPSDQLVYPSNSGADFQKSFDCNNWRTLANMLIYFI